MDNRLSLILKSASTLQSQIANYKKTQTTFSKKLEKVNKCQLNGKKKANKMKMSKGVVNKPKKTSPVTKAASPKKASSIKMNRPLRRRK